MIIEFQSLAAAKAAYEAPEYQEMLKLRKPHSDVSLSILEEGDHAGPARDCAWEAEFLARSVAIATGERL